MQPGKTSELIRQVFAAWETHDRGALEALLANDFTFTSPNDDHLNKAQYFEICWAHNDKIRSYRILNLVEDGNDGFVRYECELTDGKKFQNTEYFKIEGNKIRAVDVYFGREV